MANILFRGNVAPTQPVAVSGGSAAKGTPLTNDEGDWNYKALNDDIQTRAPINNPSFTGVVNFGNAIGSTSTNYRRFISAFDANITTSGYRIGEYLPTGNTQNTTIVLEVAARASELYARSKTTIAIRSNTLPAVVVSIQSVVERNGSLGLDIQAWTDTTTGKVVIFAVPNMSCQNMTSTFDVYEKNSYNGFTLINTLTLKDVTGLAQVTPTSMSSYGYSIDFSQVTGTIPGDRGVTAGSTNTSFVTYNGTTSTAGQFDGGTTNPSNTNRLNFDGHFYATKFYGSGAASGDANVSFVTYNSTTSGDGVFDGGSAAPSATTRLNYGGHFYATRFYGDGSNLTTINAGNISSGTLSLARGGTGQTSHLAIVNASISARWVHIDTNYSVQSGGEYSLWGALTFTVTLPPSPNVGESIIFHNGWNNWNTGTVTIARGNATHTINGLAENVLVDSNATRKLTFTYIATNVWVVSAG